MREFILRYSEEHQQAVFYENGQYRCADCGERLDVWDQKAGKWQPDRLEISINNQWYLVNSRKFGNQLDGLTVRQ